MTAYETVMVVLTSLAFIVSIIGIIVKLLLIIIEYYGVARPLHTVK